MLNSSFCHLRVSSACRLQPACDAASDRQTCRLTPAREVCGGPMQDKDRLRGFALSPLNFWLFILPLILSTCNAHWPPEPTTWQRTFTNSRGARVKFTLWSAKRVWRALPFQGGDAAYIRFAENSLLLHDGSFG